MGKIKKAASPRHEATISPALSDFIKKATSVPLIELPRHLDSFPRRWDFPRGDLYHWIVPLNRFDDILERFIALYGLGSGPQTRKFGYIQLLEGSESVETERNLRQLGFDDDGDRKLIESILDFSRLLLEKCGNRSLYSSGERLNDLLNTSSLPLLHTTLRLALCLAQRFHARHKPTHFHHGSLLAHYGLEIDRIQTLAAPLPRNQTLSRKAAPNSPVKASKSKEWQNENKGARNPNDFLALCEDTSLANGSTTVSHADVSDEGKHDWEQCVKVQVLFQPESTPDTGADGSSGGRQTKDQEDSPTSSPLGRLSTNQGSKLTRVSSADEPGTLPSTAIKANNTSPPQRTFESSPSTLLSSSIEDMIQLGIETVPKSSHYELLHKLRVAYALLGTSQSRREILALRVLAVSNLAYITSDSTFQQRFLAQDREEPKRQQFIHQLANLLHRGTRDPQQVPIQLQTHAINALRALIKQKSALPDVNAALNVSANHGTLLFLLQKALDGLDRDGELGENALGDEWRESLFALIQAILLSSAPPSRPGEVFASPQLISSYVRVLNLRTKNARKVYLEVLQFFDAFYHHVKDGIAVLSNNRALEAVIDLLKHETTQAIDDVTNHQGYPPEYRTPSIDYQTTYPRQQTIRSILPFLHGVITQPGAHADRILRSLIDSQNLLSAFRLIIEKGPLFGAHIWSEVVKVMSTFLNNEPTSYTILAEAGLTRSFLESIVLRPLSRISPTERGATASDSSGDASTIERRGLNAEMGSNDGPLETDAVVEALTCVPQNNPQGILPAAEAIANVSQAFSAVCLTAAGSEFFQASGALEKFFDIFESPAHIKVMKDASFLQILGNSFDELVRHHPTLKAAVMSAVLVMVSRIRHLCKSKAWEVGAGAKLWDEGAEDKLRVAGGSGALVTEVLPVPHHLKSEDGGSLYLQLPNDKRLLAATTITGRPPDEPVANETDKYGLTVLDYLMPITSFLIGLFENPSLCAAFMDAGGTGLVLDLATLQSLPYNFGQSAFYGGVSHELAQVLHMMAETKPHLVLPMLLDRILAASSNLHHFAISQPEDLTCYVDSLIATSDKMSDMSSKLRPEDGTFFAKNMVILQLLVSILSEVFSSPMYHPRNREQPAPFAQVNLADLYAEVCEKLGVLSAACYRESKALEKRVSQPWADATRLNESSRRTHDEITGLSQKEDASSSRDLPQDPSAPASEAQDGTEPRPSSTDLDLKRDEKTAPFKNLKVLRRLIFQLPQSVTHCFNQLGHGLLGRKRLDTYQKQNTLMVGSAIAGALIYQLDPPFFQDAKQRAQEQSFISLYFSYHVEVLKSCSSVLFDFTASPDHANCLTVVALPFKAQGGIQALKLLGEQFYHELKSCQLASNNFETMTAANSGLQSIMSIFENLTSSKCVVDSSQSNTLKSSDRSKPHHFNPAQFLLELRSEALPFVRTIWESPYAEQASRAVLQKLIAILRHILSGEQEQEAYKNSDKIAISSSLPPKKFALNADKLATLTLKGYNEDLVQEALFRCNNSSSAAEEYCKMYTRDPTLRRHPLPPAESQSVVPAASTSSTPREDDLHDNEHGDNIEAASTLTNVLGHLRSGQPLLDLLGAVPPNELPAPNLVAHSGEPPAAPQDNATRVEDTQMRGVENAVDEGSVPSSSRASFVPGPASAKSKGSIGGRIPEEKSLTVLDLMSSQREQIRSDLAERCLNIINSHYDVTWELSELLKSATNRLPESEAIEFRDTACSLLITSLVSLQSDLEAEDLSEATRKKISACAHFVALLIQDKHIYKECLPHLQQSFDSLLRFLQIPSKESNNDASLPWIGQVLLIVERMLSDDAEPLQITWNMPASIDGPLPEAAVAAEKITITKEQKDLLFESLLEVLPHVGKDKSLALSIARVLVILTRDRRIAVKLSDKRNLNLQRLFVMMKQLANMADDRIHSSMMLILRHVIEDDDTIRQIMRSEIVANFDTRSSRQMDTTTYVRNLYHLVLRSPEIFVQVTNEKLKLQQFDTNQRPQTLMVKPDEPSPGLTEPSIEQQEALAAQSTTSVAAVDAKHSVEATPGESLFEETKGKNAELRPPIVEHQDGVIHFLLSQLLSYRDVEDKDSSPASTERPVTSPADTAKEVEMGDVSAVSTPRSDAPVLEKVVEKPSFTGEDHPIFIYRCFLLQCITELLHSYNRTKIEFINFSRKPDHLATTPSKPRAGVLNYLLNSLIPLETIDVEDSIQYKKRSVTSEWASKVIIALCSKTGEQGLVMGRERYTNYARVEDNDNEPDLTFVRKFVLEHGLKVFKDASASSEPLQTRYARMLCLSNLFHQMLSKPSGNEGTAGSNNSSHKVLAKIMFEKNFISVLTSSLADIDLTFPGAKRVVKYILKPLNELTDTAVDLSLNSSTTVASALGQSEEDNISSASSVSENDEEREETPDLFRNSALGMLDPHRQDESNSELEADGEDDEMYQGDYADDMEFEEDVGPIVANDGEVVSDEDVDEENGPGDIEGLSGDVPMDIELVMDDPHMELDTDDGEDDDEDDEEGEEDDDDDGDEDDESEEDGEDYLVDIDDVVGGELNADDENASLADGEGEWQDAEDPEHDAHEDDSEDELEEIMGHSSTAGENPNNDNGEMGEQGPLNNLLSILGETANAQRPTGGEMGDLLGRGDIEHVMQELQDEDEDDENEEDVDENEDDLAYQTFNDMLNAPDSPWLWEEGAAPAFHRNHHHHPPSHHHHHFRAAPGQYTSFMSRHITGHGLPMPGIHRSHRGPPPPRPADDGTNPLLQQPGPSMPTGSQLTPSPIDLVHGLGHGFMGYLPTGPGPGIGSGGMLDAIMEAMQRGDGTVEMIDPSGRIDIRVDTTPARFNDMLGRPSFPSSPPRNAREDPQRIVAFNPLSTVFRWQEEARLLFGMSYVEKTQKVVNKLLSVLVPPAIEEEKARLKKAEEDRKREEDERAERERKERQEKEENGRKLKQEEEDRAAAAEARAQAVVEEAASASAVPQEEATVPSPSEQAELMQDVRPSDSETGQNALGDAQAAPSDTAAASAEPSQRIFTTIRGRQLDITNMSIDAEYLEALPEEIREEVIMQQYAEQRHQAEEQGQPPTDINREFLEALPDEIREELLQQEATERRRRERDAARRRAADPGGGPPRAEEMDADSFMATLDPALRRSILADQSEEVLNALAPEYAAEARAMVSRQLHHFGSRMPLGREAREERIGNDASSAQKEQRKQVVQMVDRAGVATLMRLMFMQQQGSARNNLHTILHNVCQHRQTRAEVISLLLSILQDGSADVSAVEKSLAHLSLRAKTVSAQKPPPPLKRTLSTNPAQSTATDMTPIMVVQQCLAALASLTQYDPHVASVFLRELETSASSRSKGNRKGKSKENRATKFAINALIGLLDRKLITENSTCMENLSNLLATITQPLTWLLRKDKDKRDLVADEKQGESSAIVPDDPATDQQAQIVAPEDAVAAEPHEQSASAVDTAMVDASADVTPVIPSLNSDAVGPSDPMPVDSSHADAPETAEETKSKKSFDPPVIPEPHLHLIVGVLAARECNGKTFRDALSTINNLSLIPGVKDVFGKELIHLSQNLAQAILVDLNDLLLKISEASSGTDIQGIATVKFSPASADQAKLLRVLTALDYLFDPKRPDNHDEAIPNTQEVLTSLYESSTFGPLWTKLSECLAAIHRREGMLSVATILLPLIESLMVVCKNTSLKDGPVARRLREQSVASPGPDSGMEGLFFNFTTEHRKILNELVRQNSKLMNGSFSLLAKNPKVLEFDNKRAYFTRQIHSRSREARHPQPPLQLSIRRDQTFLDSFKSLYFKSADEMKYGKLSIRFHGEEGVDAGGVTREWFQVLARGMFNPNYALFIPVASDRTTFHPNRLSGVNSEHLMFFKFIGRIIGKALYEGRVLDCHFSRAVYKKILGSIVSLKDMETLDLDYYKSLVWMRENDITDIITETFSIESDDFGVSETIDLIENGRNIPVTEENKLEYIQLVVEYRLTGSVKEQLENFLKGFHDIIPAELVSIFTEQELELLISGLPDIDVDDWKANTEYHNYTTSSPQIQWFWRAVRSFDKEEQAKLLQFVTGTSKVPLNGFKELEGMNGFSRFNIHKDYGNKERLPSSHTCFNQLDLPEYENYETLRQRVVTAMLQGSEYFGFA